MCALLGAVLLSSCGGEEVPVDVPDLDGEAAAACRALVDALPDTLAGELRRPVDPDDAPAAAWGDPALVLTCGVPTPAGYEPTAHCSEVAGVGWYVPEDQLGDLGAEVVATALTHTPYVELRVPPRYRTDGLDGVLADLARPMRRTLGAGRSCL